MLDEPAVEAIIKSYQAGGKVLICGNGGLAAEAEHFASELVGKYAFDIFIPCFALTSPSALITALGNDIGFENVFSHQVMVMGDAGDVLIGMTTSWSSNILGALRVAKQRGLYTILLCGYEPEEFALVTDYCIRARDKTNTQTIQEGILHSLHQIAYDVKEALDAACRQPE